MRSVHSLEAAALVVALAGLLGASRASAQEPLEDAQACYAGELDRCATAGDAYHEGTGVPVSWDLAAQLYRYGCRGADLRSCRAMGWIHQQSPGHGVRESLAEALRHYQLACDGGYALACYDIGTLYWTGQGVPESWSTGQAYYERSCTMGHADACREVAYIFGRAMGVTRDYARMGALLRQACELGSTTACEEMRDPVGSATRADGGDAATASTTPEPLAVGMPDPQFQDVLQRFRRDRRTAAQVTLARDLARGGVRLTCEQITIVMQTSPIDSTRLQLATTLWPRAVDPQRFELLMAALEYDGSRTLLRQQTAH